MFSLNRPMEVKVRHSFNVLIVLFQVSFGLAGVFKMKEI